MSKNIVFVSIFDLTRVFYEIARALQKRGHHVFWLTTNEQWTDWLVAQGVNREDVQQLVYDASDFLSASEKASVTGQIVDCERQADVTVNQSLLMDRFVLYKNKPDINEYMLLYYRDIKVFLQDKQADLVFAEPTNCNEMMTYLVCRELGTRFLAPWDMRFPNQRFIFNEGYLQSDLAPGASPGGADIDLGRRLLEHFERNQSVPFTFKKFSEEKVVDARKAASSTANRLRQLLRNSCNHLTHHDFSERVGTAIARIWNGFYLKYFCRYDDLDALVGRLAFYPLHVQPESSIDVQGSFFNDQLKLIRDIRRSLPFDTTLMIKEHPNFLGQRGRRFFKELRRIPGVKLVPYQLSTFDIYKRAAIVFSITGTSAYEAGMLGIPAVTFTRMYFGGFSSIRHCGSIVELKPIVFDLLDNFEQDYEADCRFMAELMNRSFEGYWTDPLFDPAVMSAENIGLLVKAFTQVVETESQ